MSDEQYKMACTKAAIGILVIAGKGPSRGLTPSQMAEDMETFSNLLADNLGMDREQVAQDVLYEFDRLPDNPFAGLGLELDEALAIDDIDRVIN